jgi:hypothetical protein
MQAQFEKEKGEEDIDRGIRLGRMEVDHNNQLTEMDRQHGERIKQIGRHAQDERIKLDNEFNTALNEAGLRNTAWINKQKELTTAAITEFDKWWEHIQGKTSHPSDADPYVDREPPAVVPPTKAETWRKEYDALKNEGKRWPAGGDGSTQYLDWYSRLLLKEDEGRRMGELGGGAMATTSARAYTMPSVPTGMAAMASGAAMGGGLSPVTLNIYGAVGQSEEALGQIVKRQLYETLTRLKQ